MNKRKQKKINNKRNYACNITGNLHASYKKVKCTIRRYHEYCVMVERTGQVEDIDIWRIFVQI